MWGSPRRGPVQTGPRLPRVHPVSTRIVDGDDPGTVFAAAAHRLGQVRLRPEVRLADAPAPVRIAPYALAMTAEVVAEVARDDEPELATGRFVLLHDPAQPQPWGGAWRVVTFASARLEPEMAADPLLAEVGWSWLTDALEAAGACYVAPSGTVTRVLSESFGALSDRPPSVDLEVRASWTPRDGDPAAHLAAWGGLLCTVAGLPPLPEGVAALPGPRR